MTCERHGGNAGSIFCRECDLETIERESMTTPTPKDAVPFDPPVFCSGIERDCKHGQLARSCHICELERDLAAALERAERAEERLQTAMAAFQEAKKLHQEAEARAEERARIITAMTQWLDQQQPDVFRRGLWDAIAEGKK